MPAYSPRPTAQKQVERSPAAIVGVILAMAVIRWHDRQKVLDNLTEQSVSTGVQTTKESPSD